MRWLRDVYEVLFRPGEGLERVVDPTRLRGGLLAVLTVGALLGIQSAATLGMPLVAGILLGLSLATAGWFFGGSLWYAASGILGGDGRWRTLLAGLGWSLLPFALSPVAASFGRWGAETLGQVLTFGLFVWSLILAVIVVRLAAGLSLGRGIASVVLVSLLVLLAPLSVGVLVLLGLAR